MDEQILKEMYEFDDNDLYYNRMGQISEKQRKAIQERANWISKKLNRGAIFLFGLAALLPCVLIPVGLLVLMLEQDWKTLLQTSGISFVWFLLWGGIGVFTWRVGNPKNDIHAKVASSRGPAELSHRTVHTDHGGHYTMYSMNCGDLKFDIDDDLVGHIHQGDEYAVYYTRLNNGATPRILSMEKL